MVAGLAADPAGTAAVDAQVARRIRERCLAGPSDMDIQGAEVSTSSTTDSCPALKTSMKQRRWVIPAIRELVGGIIHLGEMLNIAAMYRC